MRDQSSGQPRSISNGQPVNWLTLTALVLFHIGALAGHCQVERKYAPRLKVADYRSVIFGPQKRASRPITPTRSFPSNAPILPQLDNALVNHKVYSSGAVSLEYAVRPVDPS